MERYDVLYTRNHLSKLLARAEAGETIEITRRGKPIARLGPIPEPEKKWTAKEALEWLEAHPIPPHLRKTPEEFDAMLRDLRDLREEER
ncbi:type II toxin-antitoxin system prevent-host-death family antitoxin [Herbiconiux moechotypicola]|uniref:Antitoxin n=1 Tax=Herbiconiux moechotypicola TaxID=637393 RepID=A0ABN3DM85_9MICO|nr:type II toxin-antitoxin system prevent-host-death family antitoxin [Herbiconiux moechotypicola]MCS5730210.1 type II toxin-antitoxin system prevent-host-death family antitoxin [Herbiconiux moechotypicola]